MRACRADTTVSAEKGQTILGCCTGTRIKLGFSPEGLEMFWFKETRSSFQNMNIWCAIRFSRESCLILRAIYLEFLDSNPEEVATSLLSLSPQLLEEAEELV